MSERTVVRTWNVLGTTYPVVRTDIDDADEGECNIAAGEIRVAGAVVPHRFWEVESHEVLGHLVAHAVGFQRALRDNFGLSAEVAEKIEEEVIARLLPVQLDTLERNGLLTRPAPPVPSEETSK